MPQSETPITTTLFNVLSSLVTLDRVAATRLVEFRTPCNKAAFDATNPEFTTRVVDARTQSYDLGIFGLLQSACALEGKKLRKVFDASGQLTGFKMVSIDDKWLFNVYTDA